MKNISVLIVFLLFGSSAIAQSTQKVPLDKRIVTGTLENGLTYYILQNKKPESKMEMRLVVNAGSILETDDQQGLAHFCEHMAFNGSKNFEKNELVDYLQTAGVKFGAHLNAYTSFDETVYMLSLPVDDEVVVEQGFLILEDWAQNLLFDSTEIEKERGVVLEEYRLGLGAQKRMMTSYIPKVLYNSTYAKRLPIGKKEVLEGFKRESITSFYRDWYRPDLMAVIIVGDVDVAKTKARIIDHFGKLKNPVNPPERTKADVPDHKETFVTTVTDAEATYGSVQIAYKIDGMYKHEGTINQFNQELRQLLFYSMLNDRIQEKTKKPDAAFTTAWVYQGELWVRNKEAVQAFGIVSGGKYLEALRQLSTEIERAREHGFTESELKRAKVNFRTRLERSLKEADKTESRSYASQLVEHFLTAEAVPSPEWALSRFDEFVGEISLTELNNQLAELVRGENRVVTMTGPDADKESMPTEADVITTLDQISQMGTEPYEEFEVPESLMSEIPNSGKLEKEIVNEEHSYHELKLANGVNVILKKTDLKNDEILFRALSPGGTNSIDQGMYNSVHLGLAVISETGVGDFSDSDLDKILAGKSVSVRPFIGSTTEGMNGRCRPQDVESMMQLIYLNFTRPRVDPEAYDAYVNRQRSFYDNMGASPSSYFQVEWTKWRYQNHPRTFSIPQSEDWEKTHYPLIAEVYQNRFANAADFTFIFIGNIEIEAFKKLAVTYLGSLIGTPETESVVDVGLKMRSGTDRFMVKKGSEPKSAVQITYHREVEYTKQEDLALDMAAEVLTIKLIEVLREDMGGVYGTSARNYFSREPTPSLNFSISFPCGPENVDTLISAALNQVAILANNGPEEKDLNKVKQTMIKTLKTDVQSNRFWLNQLVSMSYYGDKVSSYSDMEKQISAMTAADVQKAVKERLTGDYLIGILNPEE